MRTWSPGTVEKSVITFWINPVSNQDDGLISGFVLVQSGT